MDSRPPNLSGQRVVVRRSGIRSRATGTRASSGRHPYASSHKRGRQQHGHVHLHNPRAGRDRPRAYRAVRSRRRRLGRQPLLGPTHLGDIAGALGVSQDGLGSWSLTQIGYALGAFLVVPLGDTVNRRRIIPVLMILCSVALAGSTFVPNFAVLLVALALVGVTTVAGQLLIPLAGDLARADQRGRTVGTVASGTLLGILISRTVSGIVADLLGWRAV
jgi:hypothetical protein